MATCQRLKDVSRRSYMYIPRPPRDTTYLWWVRRLEAYSRRRNSDSLDPYLMTEVE